MARALTVHEVKTALAGRQLCGARLTSQLDGRDLICTMPFGHGNPPGVMGAAEHHDLWSRVSFTSKQARRVVGPDATPIDWSWMADAVQPGGALAPQGDDPDRVWDPPATVAVSEVVGGLAVSPVIDWKSKIAPVRRTPVAVQEDLFGGGL